MSEWEEPTIPWGMLRIQKHCYLYSTVHVCQENGGCFFFMSGLILLQVSILVHNIDEFGSSVCLIFSF